MENTVLPALLRVTNRRCVVDIRSVFTLPRSTTVILSGAAEKGGRIGKKKQSRGGVEVFVVEAQPSGENQGVLCAPQGYGWELDQPFCNVRTVLSN